MLRLRFDSYVSVVLSQFFLWFLDFWMLSSVSCDVYAAILVAKCFLTLLRLNSMIQVVFLHSLELCGDSCFIVFDFLRFNSSL